MGHIPKMQCQLWLSTHDVRGIFFLNVPNLDLTHETLGKVSKCIWKTSYFHIEYPFFKTMKIMQMFIGERSLPLLRNRGKKPPLHSPFALHMLKFMIIFGPCVLYVILSSMEHSPNARLNFSIALSEAFYYENAFTLGSTFQVQVRK